MRSADPVIKNSIPKIPHFEYTEQHMGIDFNITLYAANDSVAQQVAQKAFDRITEIEKMMSIDMPDSEINSLSATAAKGQMTEISNELWDLLYYAREVAERSKGTYDFTAGALNKRWKEAFQKNKMPSKGEITQAQKTIGIKKVTLKYPRKVEIWGEGLMLDLGGLAKGYAMDEALKVLKTQGFASAMVDGDGNILAGDPPPDETGWKVERFVYEDGKIKTLLTNLVNEALATSGEQCHFIRNGGQIYSDIIDPRTGYGITDRQIVTVIAPTCAEAAAWADAMNVEAVTKAFLYLREKGVRVLFSEY